MVRMLNKTADSRYPHLDIYNGSTRFICSQDGRLRRHQDGSFGFPLRLFSSAFAPRLQAWLGCSNLRFLCLSTFIAQMITLYTVTGIYLPLGGFRTPMETYFQAVYFGIVSD
jgi:hypothetical protein